MWVKWQCVLLSLIGYVGSDLFQSDFHQKPYPCVCQSNTLDYKRGQDLIKGKKCCLQVSWCRTVQYSQGKPRITSTVTNQGRCGKLSKTSPITNPDPTLWMVMLDSLRSCFFTHFKQKTPEANTSHPPANTSHIFTVEEHDVWHVQSTISPKKTAGPSPLAWRPLPSSLFQRKPLSHDFQPGSYSGHLKVSRESD